MKALAALKMSRWQNNYLPALVWAGVIMSLPHWSLDPLGILMGFRAGLVLRSLLIRALPTRRAPFCQIMISWASTFLPFAMRWHPGLNGSAGVGTLIVILGSFLVSLACIDLGRSFGISPAVRPFVRTGIYHWMRNPMYMGHLLTELGIVMASPSALNCLIIAASWALYTYRVRWERGLHQTHEAAVTHASNMPIPTPG